MSDKEIVLVTGANTGLGYEIIKALYKTDKPYEIIVGARSLDKGEAAVSTLKGEVSSSKSTLSLVQVDLASDESITKAYETISSKFDRLDCLINNAGQGFDRQIVQGNMSIREAWMTSWNVNVVGTEILTHALMPLLLKSSNPRLIFMTSGTSSIAETERQDGPMYQRLNHSPEKGWPKDKGINPISSYRSTKTGLNMNMREWHLRLKNDGVKVWCISPGFLATGLAGIGPDMLRKVS
jgi:NAD(P)-dependent dehydrogenase (short-subunit alcohol dehydrogenase family)